MSAAVVTIHGNTVRKRQNRKEDGDTIRLRRMLAATEAAAFEDHNAEALAMSWAMARKLPCSNLRCIAGTLDARDDFNVRLADVELARTEHDALSAKMRRALILHGDDAANEMRVECDRLWHRYWQATCDMANTVVFTQHDLRRKKAAIGGVWLRAQGERYASLRAAVARDEARLQSASKQGRA